MKNFSCVYLGTMICAYKLIKNEIDMWRLKGFIKGFIRSGKSLVKFEVKLKKCNLSSYIIGLRKCFHFKGESFLLLLVALTLAWQE